MTKEEHYAQQAKFHEGMSGDHAGLSVEHQECADASEGKAADCHKAISEYHASIAARHEKHAAHFKKCMSEGVSRKADYGVDFAKAHELEPRAAAVFPVPRFGAPNFTAPSSSTNWTPPAFKASAVAEPNVPSEFVDLVKVEHENEL